MIENHGTADTDLRSEGPSVLRLKHSGVLKMEINPLSHVTFQEDGVKVNKNNLCKSTPPFLHFLLVRPPLSRSCTQNEFLLLLLGESKHVDVNFYKMSNFYSSE